MRISDWSSDVCSSDLVRRGLVVGYSLGWLKPYENQWLAYPPAVARHFSSELAALVGYRQHRPNLGNYEGRCPSVLLGDDVDDARSEEHTSELQSLMRISYAVFCLKKKTTLTLSIHH